MMDLILAGSLLAAFFTAFLLFFSLVSFLRWLIPSKESPYQRLKTYEKAWKSRPETAIRLFSREKVTSVINNYRKPNKFENQLPDCLTMISGALRAGYSPLQSINLASGELADPVAGELKRVVKEVSLGLSADEALENMAARVKSQSFDWTVVAMNIQKEVGGNLAEVLERVASTLRSRKRFKRHVSSLTAEGRMSASVLVILPLFEGLLLYIVNPSYVSLLFTTALGISMVTGALVLMVIGWFWMKKIIDIKI